MKGPGLRMSLRSKDAQRRENWTMSAKPSAKNAPGVGSIRNQGISVWTALRPIYFASLSRCCQWFGWIRKCCTEPAKSRIGDPSSRKVPFPSANPAVFAAVAVDAKKEIRNSVIMSMGRIDSN